MKSVLYKTRGQVIQSWNILLLQKKNSLAIADSLIMTTILSALESMSTEEGEGRAGLVVPAGHALNLQLEVQLQRLGGHQVGQ